MIHDNLNILFSIQNTVLLVTKIAFEKIDKPYPLHMHSKNCYEFHYVDSGNGNLIIDETRYDLEPDTFYMTGPFIKHAQIPSNGNFCEYGVYMEIIPEKLTVTDGPVIDLIKSNPFWLGKNNPELLYLFEKIFNEFKTCRIGYIQNIEAHLKLLIIALVRSYSNSKSNTSVSKINTANIDDRKLLIIDNAFLNDYKTITLTQLSEMLGLSNRQTERLLKNQFGKTFLEKKTEARMASAVILLKNHDYSVTYISEVLGYSTCEHFSSAFKKHYGITAREYRKLL